MYTCTRVLIHNPTTFIYINHNYVLGKSPTGEREKPDIFKRRPKLITYIFFVSFHDPPFFGGTQIHTQLLTEVYSSTVF